MNQFPDNTSANSAAEEQRQPDPFLEEVWALKREAAERAGNSMDRLFEQLAEIEKTMPNPRAAKPTTSQDQREKRAS